MALLDPSLPSVSLATSVLRRLDRLRPLPFDADEENEERLCQRRSRISVSIRPEVRPVPSRLRISLGDMQVVGFGPSW